MGDTVLGLVVLAAIGKKVKRVKMSKPASSTSPQPLY